MFSALLKTTVEHNRFQNISEVVNFLLGSKTSVYSKSTYLPKALNSATISVLLSWNVFLAPALTVDDGPIPVPENKIFNAVPMP